MKQQIRFCTARDGVRIAYARHGSGPPLVIATSWLSHLQYDLQSPVWCHFLSDLGEIATVVRYDERGHGLSEEDAFALLRQTAMRHRTTIEQLSADMVTRGGMPNRSSRTA